MVDLKISISESYSNSKYFIIDACDLNKMSSLQVSNIINNNTLIINLLNENDIKYKNMIYMEDEHINKLFLFNIMKNSDYKSFIYERIIKDDQYNQRVDFMKIDKTNMIKSCGIVKHIKEFINKKNKYDELYQSDYKSVKFLCDEDSLIYIADKNKLLFIK